MNTATAENRIVYTASAHNFSKIPGSPIAYWVSHELISLFMKEKFISQFGDARQGLITGDNGRFLRFWYEISLSKFGFVNQMAGKWYPYNKGGSFRRWYGNNDLVVNWENDGYEIKNNKDGNGRLLSRPQNTQYFFKKSITWTALTSGSFNARYSSDGFLFDAKGSSMFVIKDANYKMILAYLNSKVANELLKLLAPTLDYNCGVVAKLPYIFDEKKKVDIEKRTDIAVKLAKYDWDSFETSWDFKKHPLI